ncbi:MAG: TlpA disulfide reductase family protein [Bacteroidota bacterium]
MQRLLIYVLTAFAMLYLPSCFVMENTFDSVAPGYWRAVLELTPREMPSTEDDDEVGRIIEEIPAGELPFTFEVKYVGETKLKIEIINGEERMELTEVVTGHNRKTGQDSIRIEFPVFDAYIIANYESTLMDGYFVSKSRGPNYRIPFRAKQGQNHRFTKLRKEPALDLSGRWECTFDLETDQPYKAVGEFEQKGNRLLGTFRTETGDYRFLEGTVQDNKVYLSSFDGAHAFLFQAKILEDQRLIGSFRSGNHYTTTWEASRNSEFELADPDSLTYLREGFDKVAFSFQNPDGKTVTLDDPAYKNKIKIVQILGTWCPNCRDETQFLTNYLERNPSDDLAVVALAFERRKDRDQALDVIRTYKDKMGIPYEILLAGSSNKKEAAEALPMLNHILSYPTMIFIDRNDKVRRIHTGFNGPATSKYLDFTVDFDRFVQSLLAEENT